jgi:hypothetical protein
MNNDPYAPPSAPVRDRRPDAPGSTWKAVSLGAVADIAATFLASIVLTAALGATMISRGAIPEQVEAALIASDAYLLTMMVAGLGCTVLGGYVAARLANQREYYHALLTGIVALVLSEVMLGVTADVFPLAYRIIGDILMLPAALFGGHLRKRRRARDAV